MADGLNGKDFVARTRISTLNDATVADVGETCERVDPKSLPWLLAQGHIAPAFIDGNASAPAAAEKKPRARKKKTAAALEHAVESAPIETRKGDA